MEPLTHWGVLIAGIIIGVCVTIVSELVFFGMLKMFGLIDRV